MHTCRRKADIGSLTNIMDQYNYKLYSMTDIQIIHSEIIELFKKYKISWETNKLPIELLQEWSYGAAELLDLDREHIRKRFSEIYWALFSVQLSLGYALISRQTCKYLRGLKGEAFSPNNIPLISVSEFHLFYHLNNSWESIYRCWERLSSLLCSIIFPNETNKLYFDNTVNLIGSSEDLQSLLKYNDLKKQIKFWNKAARERNKISHRESSPMKIMQTKTDTAHIYGPNNEYIPKVTFTFSNLLNDINNVRDNYYRIVPAVLIVKEYCELYIKHKTKL
ncbi:MAG: hypothetical protein FD122_2496 [Stygiobacter sp.]|nr:MAG: hypothetical protein FD122_2496 [Stygiobacter sp.]KAF0214464.1 MAG: hypothetical protein FD178_2419 [Ignavibacteria bacterium]